MDLKITPSGQTIVKPTALGPVANTDTKLLIYGLFQKGRVLAQDGVGDIAQECAVDGFRGVAQNKLGLDAASTQAERCEDAECILANAFGSHKEASSERIAVEQDGHRAVPAETDPAGAPELGVSFAMAARARRVAAESPPWVRHWRSCKRTRRRKTRESELGGAAPKVCSQTRRKLAKSKPSRTTFRPTPVSCGITERSLKRCYSRGQRPQTR